MALNPNPTPILCGNRWRHRNDRRQVIATTFIKGPDLIGWAPRCDPCFKNVAGSISPIDAVTIGDPILGIGDDDPRGDGRPAPAEHLRGAPMANTGT